MTRVIAAVALLALLPFTRSAAQCTDADRAALEALDKAWLNANLTGDRSYLEGLYASNFMGHNVGAPADKPAAIANALTAFEANKANPQPAPTPDRYMISCTPTTATITHRNTAVTASGGAPTYSRSVHFLEKRGNRWQVVSATAHPLTDQQHLLYMEMEWNDAAKRHDVAWFERNYAPFASDVSSRTGAIATKAETVGSERTDKTVFDVIELSELSARVEGDVGVVTGVNHVKGKDAQGKPFDRRVRFTDTFIKRDGRWQVWATQGTTIQ